MTFSESFKSTREAKGFTQEEAARKIGVSVKTVYRWEAGESDPQTGHLSGLRVGLGLSDTEFLSIIKQLQKEAS